MQLDDVSTRQADHQPREIAVPVGPRPHPEADPQEAVDAIARAFLGFVAVSLVLGLAAILGLWWLFRGMS